MSSCRRSSKRLRRPLSISGSIRGGSSRRLIGKRRSGLELNTLRSELRHDGNLNSSLERHSRGANDRLSLSGSVRRHRRHSVDLSWRPVADIHVQITYVVHEVAHQMHHVVYVVEEALSSVVRSATDYDHIRAVLVVLCLICCGRRCRCRCRCRL